MLFVIEILITVRETHCTDWSGCYTVFDYFHNTKVVVVFPCICNKLNTSRITLIGIMSAAKFIQLSGLSKQWGFDVLWGNHPLSHAWPPRPLKLGDSGPAGCDPLLLCLHFISSRGFVCNHSSLMPHPQHPNLISTSSSPTHMWNLQIQQYVCIAVFVRAFTEYVNSLTFNLNLH